MINALVVAGSPNSGKLKHCSQEPFEALIPIGGPTMVEYVVGALKNTPQIKNIVVVGPAQLTDIFTDGTVQVVVYHNGIVDNIATGYQHLSGSDRILIASADIPLITPEIINYFINCCADASYDLYFPVIPKAVMEAHYPTIERTYVSLQDGTFTAGNVFIAKGDKIPEGLKWGREFIELRKSPLKLSRLLGINFVMKFLTHRLTIAEIEQRASDLLHLRGKAVICKTPELGIDVDKPEDLSLVTQTLQHMPGKQP